MTIIYDNPQDYKDEVSKFIEDCVYAVESNSFEDLKLWQQYHTTVDWVQITSGYLPTVGMLGDHPVCVSVGVNIINGHRVLFYNACSRFVDHDMVDDWVKKRIKNKRNMTNAMNFHHVIHHIVDLNKCAT